MSYYQDVRDSFIPVEDVKAKLDSICEILDTNPPETIIYEEEWGSFTSPRLRDRGNTIILYKSREDSVVNWQICNLYRTLAIRKSPQWTVSHCDPFMLLPMFFVFINLFILFLGIDSFDMSLAYVGFLLQFPFAGVGLYMKKVIEENLMLWKDTMKQAGLWSDDRGSIYEKAIKKYSHSMVLVFISFALLFGWLIIVL